MDLEEERQDVTVGRLRRVEDDLDRLRMPGVVAVRRVIDLPAGIPDTRAEHARQPTDEVLHPPEAAAGEDCGLCARPARDLSAVMDPTGHDVGSSVLVSDVANNGRYSP